MELNIVIAGEEYTGKTSIFNRLRGEEFSDDHYPTHATNLKVIDYDYKGTSYKLKLRDTPGMDKYTKF